MLASNIALYIGAPIDEESERAVLGSVFAALTERAVPAAVLANLQLGGRQLDFVVATDQVTLVVEAKASALPMRGQHNGEWAALTRLGRWKPVRNAYLQALQAKNALRDAMRARDESLSGYPNACVVFTPQLHPASELATGDYKVSICSIPDLAAQIAQVSGMRWGIERWQQFAEAHALQRVPDAESALDGRMLDAQRTLTRYAGAFSDTYSPLAARHVPDTYVMDGQQLALQDVEAALIGDRADLLIQGPSGCGKSLLSFRLANQLLTMGAIPVVIDCKSFDGQLGSSLDREAALLDMPSAAALLAAARRLNRPIAAVVDGYNECPQANRPLLTRALRAASIRYDAMVLVTSQTDIERADLLPLHHVHVGAPSKDLKEKIARVNADADAALIPLLEVVTTGLEAGLVGQVGRSIPASSSRFALFDFYVRSRLGESAADGIRLLCAMAERLMLRVTFSLSVREADRLTAELGLPASTLARTQRSDVLTVRGDRVSFSHEMYLNVFAAEAVIRKVGSDADAILVALAAPRHSALRTFLVGAIDDESLLAAVLSSVSDGKLLASCLNGECGGTASNLVTAALAALPVRLEEEAARLRFQIVGDGWWNIEVVPESRTTWSEHDNAMLTTLAVGLTEGRWVKEVGNAVRRMDATLVEEFRRLHPEALEKRVKIRSSLFAVAYMFGKASIGLSRTVDFLHSGVLSLQRATNRSRLLAPLELLWQEATSPGLLYLAMALSRDAYELRDDLAQYAIPFLQPERWKYLPYHAQLDLLHFVNAPRRVPAHLRDELIDALQAILPVLHPLMTELAFEALSGLGALEEESDEHVTQVREEIQGVLASPDSESAAAIAWRTYNAQFDHPFSDAYVQAINELSREDRLALLRLACAGGSGDYFFFSTLFEELSKAGDIEAAPIILRWTTLPSPRSNMPQQAIETFIAAFVALGRLGIELPADVCSFGRAAREDALIACGVLYYWTQRREPSSVLDEPSAAAAMNVLLRPDQEVAAGVLYEISHSFTDSKVGSTAVVRAFPDQAVAICRAALDRPDGQVGYLDRRLFADEAAISNFAIDVLGRFGSAFDLTRLRSLVDDPKLASKALDAVKAIEARVSGAVSS